MGQTSQPVTATQSKRSIAGHMGTHIERTHGPETGKYVFVSLQEESEYSQ